MVIVLSHVVGIEGVCGPEVAAPVGEVAFVVGVVMQLGKVASESAATLRRGWQIRAF